MAASSNSDDSSDIFWPGYVDAVTNLAINLLFVIALMAIVVIASVMQLSKMQQKTSDTDKVGTFADASAVQRTMEEVFQLQQLIQQAQKTADPTPKQVQEILDKAKIALEKSASSQKELLEDVAKLEKKLNQMEKVAIAEKAQMAKDKANSDKASSTEKIAQADKAQRAKDKAKAEQAAASNEDAESITLSTQQPTQVVQAKERPRASSVGKNSLQDLTAGGIVVAFAPDVLELSDPEAAELVQKITASGSTIKGARWQLRVVSPKGFTEASRMAYYRLNTIRNVLIKNGAAPADIDTRVLETESSNANNARILVRLMP